eukprot:scpid64145/ scgid25100/ CST complex subunit STN1; Alpha-accessory factor of 44 kDa; Oligonucleotide/oligosaccharide-binding fold-containing protein 1; Suppressor of cdc thirteen homolog
MAADSVPEPSKWGLDPTFWSFMKLANVQVLSLVEHSSHEECFLLGNRVVSKVQVLGDIVSVHERERNVQFCVDDGSAVLTCVLWKNRDAPDWDAATNGLALGSVVHALGKIKVFRGERQLTVSSWRIIDDVHAQCVHWMEVVQLNRDIYSQPAKYEQPGVPWAAVTQSASNTATATHSGKMPSGFAAVLEKYFNECSQDDKSFLFEEIQEVTELRRQACKMLGFSDAVTPEQCKRLKRFFASNVRQLATQGVLYQTDIVTDQYAVVSTAQHIVPVVRALLRNACAHGYQHMSEKQIADGVRGQPHWTYVTSAQIRDAVHHCLHSGDIYEVDGGYYRPV